MKFDIIAVLLVKVFSALAGVIILSLITNSLASSEVGRYFYLLSLILIVVAISSLGLNNVVLRKVSSQPQDAGSIINTSSLIVIIAAIFILPLSILFLINIGYENTTFILLAIISQVFIGLVSHGLQGIGKPKQAIFFGGLLNQLILLIALYLNKNFSLNLLIEFYATCQFIAAILVLSIWYKYIGIVNTVINDFRSFLIPASSLIAFQIFSEMNIAIGQLLMGAKGYTRDLAIYAICLKFVMLTSYISFAVNRVVAPDFAKAFSTNDIMKLESLIKKARNFSLTLSIPVVLLIVIFADKILYFFGSDYSQYAWYLSLAAGVQIFSVMNSTLAYFMIMCGYEKQYTKQIIYTFIVVFSAGIFLIDLNPLIISLIAFLFIQLWPLLFSTRFIKKNLRIDYWALN